MIIFTQFVRPYGRREDVSIERSPEIEATAKLVVQAGGRFEVEVLLTGEVSFEIVRGDEEEPESLAIEIIPNGPDVLAAVDRLVANAYKRIVDGPEKEASAP